MSAGQLERLQEQMQALAALEEPQPLTCLAVLDATSSARRVSRKSA